MNLFLTYLLYVTGGGGGGGVLVSMLSSHLAMDFAMI